MALSFNIRRDDLADGEVGRLLSEHRAEMHLYSPAESIHALDASGLNNSSIQFWSAWVEDELAACGALMELSDSSGEIKSMRTSPRFQRMGIAASILDTVLEEARARGYQRVYLETGTHAAFSPAVALYQKFGFTETEPFGGYTEDPNSRFMKLDIENQHY